MGRKLFAGVVVWVAMVLLILPAEGQGGTIHHEFTSKVSVFAKGPVQVDTEVRNSGDAVGFHPLLTYFLADLAEQSDDLGDSRPGGILRYRCVFQGEDLRPGNYILVTRLTFAGQEGEKHRAYHFSPFTYGTGGKAMAPPPVTLGLESPSFNLKALLQETRKVGVILKNSLQKPVKVFVTYYLPDGFATPEPEKFYDLGPGEEKKEEIPLTFDPKAFQSPAYQAVVWYEIDGVRYAERADGQIAVEEKPVMVQLFAGLVIAIILAVAAVLLYRKRVRG